MWTEIYLPPPIHRGFPRSSAGKESACNARDPGSIPGLGRSPGEGIGYPLQYSWASLVAQVVKNLRAVWETRVWSLGREDPLEEGMANHSSILAWRIPMDREAWWATVFGVTGLDTTERQSTAPPDTYTPLKLGCFNILPLGPWGFSIDRQLGRRRCTLTCAVLSRSVVSGSLRPHGL